MPKEIGTTITDTMEIIKDIICQVYAGDKSKVIIEKVLQEFIPGYEKLNLDYASRVDDENYIFTSEDEMIHYFIENKGFIQTFYWNKYTENPDKIMLGADITQDDKLIISLTVDGSEETGQTYFKKLKEILKSTIGVISHVNPADYKSGQDFILRYSQNSSL